MKTFYLLRHEDVSGTSGAGVVAEGVIFDNGMVAMTWLSKFKTVTMFPDIRTVDKIHSHEGKTELIIEGRRGHQTKFDRCKEILKENRKKAKVLEQDSE